MNSTLTHCAFGSMMMAKRHEEIFNPQLACVLACLLDSYENLYIVYDKPEPTYTYINRKLYTHLACIHTYIHTYGWFRQSWSGRRKKE